MPDDEEPLQQNEHIQNLNESVDFGDLKNELVKSPKPAEGLEKLERSFGSANFGDLKNELTKGVKSKP